MFAKKNGRVSFRSNKRSNYRKNNLYSNNKPRHKGNIPQLHDKYSKLAKEASSSGDKIQSEYYFQFADHYFRLMNELGLKSFNNENISESASETATLNENKTNESKEKDIIINENDEIDNSLDETSESIESVPFIAKPIQKKSTKSKKEVS